MTPKKDEYMRGYGDGFKEGAAHATDEILALLTAHELYRYRPKAFDGFIEYCRPLALSTTHPDTSKDTDSGAQS